MSKIKLAKQYNRLAVEKKWRQYWAKEKIFEFSFDPKKPIFAVDTPPPYVSAEHLHAGHIMSYTQAEFIVRYKRLKGFNVFYPMGFDDNGLPTERFVETKYKVDKSKISRQEFIKLCLKETARGEKLYKKLWDELGISVDWTKTYSTIAPLATKISQWSLIDLYKKGALYRQEAPVLWCPYCRTAIAQAELEHKEERSKLNYIKFKAISGKDLVISTTRPELLPACVGLYANPKDKRYKAIIGKKALVPLFDYQVPILTSPEVDMEFGTGLMMVCTWGDKDDLKKWQKDKLKTRPLLSRDGKLQQLAGKYQGLKIAEAREQIIDDLQKQGLLVSQQDITHTLNVHERCLTPAEFILSKQWFIKITQLKNVWLKYGHKIKWHPQFRFKDYQLWVESLQWDWCISRQRYYGVPFPVWYCSQCEEPIFAKPEMLPVIPNETKPPLVSCPKCKNTNFVPETDVMDTWATSSCTPFLIKHLVKDKKVQKKLFPVTLRPNGFEIIRTWDFYSIVKSYYHFGKIPFQEIMISGHGLDEKGRKISKRLGNYVPASQLIKEYGADAIRYWATGAKLGHNLRFSHKEINRGKRTTIKLWNVARFLLLNLDGFDYSEDQVLENSDVWIISQLNKTIKKVTKAFDNYTYAKARNEIESLFWSKLCDYYVEFVKYRLAGKDKQSKKAAQATLFKVFLAILKMYSPILPFLTEELYQRLFRKYEKKKSIHVCSWPKPLKKPKRDISDFDQVLKAIDEIRKFKSENKIPLGKEIESYSLKTPVNLAKYGQLLKKTGRVKILKGRKK